MLAGKEVHRHLHRELLAVAAPVAGLELLVAPGPDLVGQTATLTLEANDEPVRTFPLRIWAATCIGELGERRMYRLDLRHTLAWALLASSHRSFQELNAKEEAEETVETEANESEDAA